MSNTTGPMYDALRNSIFVALGGAAGTLLRHALNLWTFTPTFPVGTAIENITGAFLLGIITGLLTTMQRSSDWLRAGVGVGFCGGYTTMSTFAADTFVLGIHQTPLIAGGYVAVSLVGGLLLAWLGIAVGRHLGRRRRRTP